MKTAIFVLLLGLCIVNTAEAGTEFTPLKLTQSQISQIKSAVTREFLDPEAAKFRDIVLVSVKLNSGRTIQRVCGFVNGKNAYGGYTGYKMFGGRMKAGKFKKVDFFGPCKNY